MVTLWVRYASGGDLLAWVMSEGSFRGGEDDKHLNIILLYMHQLLDGVQFLHDSNFVHRCCLSDCSCVCLRLRLRLSLRLRLRACNMHLVPGTSSSRT